MSITSIFAFSTYIVILHAKVIIDEEIIVDVPDEMRRAGIVPKIIPVPPPKILDVFLTNGRLIPGARLFHDYNNEPPGFIYEANESAWYTFFKIAIINWDPDEKLISRSPGVTRPTQQSEWHEWLIVNIPGNQYMRGEEIYRNKRPGHDTSLEVVDLYLFLVYQQPGKIKYKKPWETVEGNRTIVQSLSDYVEYYNLTGPIAGNFHYAEWVHCYPEEKMPYYVPPP